MFNANLDASSSERKTLQQLRKELKKWEESSSLEKTLRRTKPNNLDVNTYVVRHTICYILSGLILDFFVQTENKATFAQLVAKARAGTARAKAVNSVDTPLSQEAAMTAIAGQHELESVPRDA